MAEVTAGPGVIVEVLIGDVVQTLSLPGIASQGPVGPEAAYVAWTGAAWPPRPPVPVYSPVFWLGGTAANPPAGAIDDDIWIRGS